MADFLIFPGFLGQASDFQSLHHELGNCQVVDPKTTYRKFSNLPISELNSDFLAGFERKSPLIGVGYSMGGRLLLQLSQRCPGFFDGLIFVSTNPGLVSQEEKLLRKKKDLEWAQKIQTADWKTLIEEWNAQDVFRGTSSEVVRNESDYDRQDLSQQMTNWSLAHQPDFRFFLRSAKTPYLWTVGERDRKFYQMAEEILPMDFLPIGGAGHRVHLDQPLELGRCIRKFVTEKIKSP